MPPAGMIDLQHDGKEEHVGTRILCVGIAMLVGGISLLCGQASAETLTCVPDDPDCWDLDHHYYYTWGIDLSPLAGLNIVEIELFFDNIRNWDDNENHLFIRLLDDAPLGLQQFSDNENDFADAFEGQGTFVADYQDTTGSGTAEDVQYLFSELGLIPTANGYAGDGVIALGLDPDCHFWNDAIRLTIMAECPGTPTEDLTWGELKRRFGED